MSDGDIQILRDHLDRLQARVDRLTWVAFAVLGSMGFEYLRPLLGV
jgi:hypothetical protein